MGRSRGVIFHGLDEVLRSRDDVTDIFEGSIVEKRRHVAQNAADHVQLRDLLLEHLLRDCQCNDGNISQENTQVGHHVNSSWNIISCVRAKPEAPPPRMQFLYFARSTPQCTPSVHTFCFDIANENSSDMNVLGHAMRNLVTLAFVLTGI